MQHPVKPNFQGRLKMQKLKRYFFSYRQQILPISAQIQQASLLISPDLPYQIFSKPYCDTHIFRHYPFTGRSAPKRTISSFQTIQKMSSNTYEAHSRIKARKLIALSYESQKQRKSFKQQIAIEGLKHIQEFKVNNCENQEDQHVRICKDLSEQQTHKPVFRNWRTIQKEKETNSRAWSKPKEIVGKRDKYSPKKGLTSMRIRKNLIKRQQFSLCKVKQVSTIQSLQGPQQKPKRVKVRKCSIAPWQIDELLY